MSAWPDVELKEIGSVTTGSTPPTSDPTYYGGDIPFVTPAELDNPIPIVNAARTLSEKGAGKARLLPAGAVLVCCIGSLGKVGIAGTTVATNQQINSIIFDESVVFPKYGFYATKLLRPKLESMAPATTVAIVSKSKFEQLTIPLPPLDEQRRIAAILDQADALRRARRRAIERLNDLGQAIFRDSFFHGSLTIPKVRMGDVVEEFRYGTSEKSTPKGLPVLRIPNVIGGRIDCEDLKNVQLNTNEVNRLRLKEGDILFVRTNGNPEYVGRCAVVTDDIQRQTGYSVDSFVYASYLIRARLDQDQINPIFLKAYLSTQIGRKLLFERAKTSAGQYNINVESLSGIEIPLPDISYQRQFASKDEKITETTSRLENHLSYLDRLFSSLQHRAFRGEL